MSQTGCCPDCGEEIALSQLLSGTHRCKRGMADDALVPPKHPTEDFAILQREGERVTYVPHGKPEEA